MGPLGHHLGRLRSLERRGAELTPERLIEQLELAPHPEGGWFRETWRGAPGPDGRSVGTAIYFLVTSSSPSRLHRVDATEIFHWYGGDEVEQIVVTAAGVAEARTIGPARPQAVVPTGAWQGLRVVESGRWCLLGCTVAPGFEFGGFELADDAAVDELVAAHPTYERVLRALA